MIASCESPSRIRAIVLSTVASSRRMRCTIVARCTASSGSSAVHRCPLVGQRQRLGSRAVPHPQIDPSAREKALLRRTRCPAIRCPTTLPRASRTPSWVGGDDLRARWGTRSSRWKLARTAPRSQRRRLKAIQEAASCRTRWSVARVGVPRTSSTVLMGLPTAAGRSLHRQVGTVRPADPRAHPRRGACCLPRRGGGDEVELPLLHLPIGDPLCNARLHGALLTLFLEGGARRSPDGKEEGWGSSGSSPR